jgi:hypothetical protein
VQVGRDVAVELQCGHLGQHEGVGQELFAMLVVGQRRGGVDVLLEDNEPVRVGVPVPVIAKGAGLSQVADTSALAASMKASRLPSWTVNSTRETRVMVDLSVRRGHASQDLETKLLHRPGRPRLLRKHPDVVLLRNG